MQIETFATQELYFTARIGASAREVRGAGGNVAKAEVPVEFARRSAYDVWAKLPEATRGSSPVVKIDVAALAKAHDVKPDEVLGALRKDALFLHFENTGALKVS